MIPQLKGNEAWSEPPQELKHNIEEASLAAILGVPTLTLRQLLEGTPAARAEGERRFYRWEDVSRLTPQSLARVREQLATALAAAPVSKRWVGGYPELVAQWHWRKNVNLTPDEVSFGSHKRVWWKCPEGPDHEWEAVAQSRTGGAGCPFCAGRKVSVTNSLATKAPAVAAQWHPQRNGELTPHGLVWSSNRKAWWKCAGAADHEWRARINNRTSNDAGCPFCAGNRVSRSNCLATIFPELAAEWHPLRNRGLTPGQVTTCSNRLVWWLCRADPRHQWKTTVEGRARGSGCPSCAGRRPSPENTLAQRKPAVARQWHPTRNGPLEPAQVAWSSNQKAWWKCPVGADHEWLARINNRTTNGTGCPFCARRRAACRPKSNQPES